MSNIHLFKRLYQPQKRRTIERPVKQQPNKIYQLNGFKHLAFLKYEGNDLRHFGIFSGQTLTVKRFIEWNDVEPHTLYVVLLPDNTPRVCAIKPEENFRFTLHDGLGGNFTTYHRFRLYLVGMVINTKREVRK